METPKSAAEIEIWGGLECTINRVGEQFFDQLSYLQHPICELDIQHFASLGIRKMRYPILWEKHEPKAGESINWELTAAHLMTLKAQGIAPIAGLLHHGSGPAFTHLLDPGFPEKLAAYALQVAQKFPWLTYYTPVNEPLTTARFSGLYGIWYPHSRDDLSFLRILMNECKASLLAMEAIRTINPKAIWIQTEDLGKTHSTNLLQYQADFENQRRWLGFDLMAGKVNQQHPLWHYLLWAGIAAAELDFFQEHAASPNIIGFNYYLTSERFLDEKIAHYPAQTHGGNGIHCYADVEAVRIARGLNSGLSVLLKEAYAYLQKPLAITEVHVHCSRDEQLRWFLEVWQIAHQLKKEEMPIMALTAWALLGSFGWNTLLSSEKGDYEPGVFDIGGGQPRPTALSGLIKSLTQGKPYNHPVLSHPGWWKRLNREEPVKNFQIPKNIQPLASLKPILIIGKNGTLGRAFARICEHRALDYYLAGRDEIDITQSISIEKMIKLYQPWAIINTAGFVRVDDAEQEIHTCFLSNTTGAENLAGICAQYAIPLLSYSSDLVFDGNKNQPYLESDHTAPLSIYGQSKALAEKRMLSINPETLIIRSSSFFGPWDEANFVWQVLQALNLKQPIFAANNLAMSPTYIPELVNTSLDLLIDGEKGIWHLANQGALTWADFASEIAHRAGYASHQIVALPAEEMDLKATRPKYSVLHSERGANLSSLDRALNHFFDQQQEIKSKTYC